MVKTYREIETKNGFKYHFWNENDVLMCTVYEDGMITDIIEGLTTEEKQYIEEISGAKIK